MTRKQPSSASGVAAPRSRLNPQIPLTRFGSFHQTACASRASWLDCSGATSGTAVTGEHGRPSPCPSECHPGEQSRLSNLGILSASDCRLRPRRGGSYTNRQNGSGLLQECFRSSRLCVSLPTTRRLFLPSPALRVEMLRDLVPAGQCARGLRLH